MRNDAFRNIFQLKKHYEVAYYFTNDNMADQSQLHPTTINKKAIDYL